MTQDNPTLTDKDLEVVDINEFGNSKIIGFYITIRKTWESEHLAEQVRQQILTALDQYPKVLELYVNNTDILLKLKAENEELKKKLECKSNECKCGRNHICGCGDCQ